MQVGAIVQARFSSQRLPGKVLRALCGKPLLAHLIDRLRRCDGLDLVVIATSTESSDDPVADFCDRSKVACYRGPLDDVLARICQAAQRFKLDGVVRLSGDSPLLDPALVDRLIELFRTGDWDLVTNVQIRSFPKGQSVEIMSLEALLRVEDMAVDAFQREHVTPYFYEHPDMFRIRNVVAEVPRPKLQLSIDTAEDFARIEAILAAAPEHAKQLSLEEAVALAENFEAEIP